MGKHVAETEPVHLRVRRYAKGMVAIAGAIGTGAATLTIGDGPLTLEDYINMVIVTLTALGVIGVKNRTKKT